MVGLRTAVGLGAGTEVEVGLTVGPAVAVAARTAVAASAGIEVEVGLTVDVGVAVPEEVAGAPHATAIVNSARPVMKYLFTCSPWPASECSTNNRHSSYRHVRTHIDTALQMGKRQHHSKVRQMRPHI